MTREMQDVYLTAYLLTAYPAARAIPIYDETTRLVSFRLTGIPDFDKALSSLYTNPPVPALDFVRHIKDLRSAILTMRGSRW